MFSINKTPILQKHEVEKMRKAHHGKGSSEGFHKSLGGEYIGDMVFGANDGIVTTFAVVAGVAGADLSPSIVLILGAANLFADGFSMAAGNFLARKSEMEYHAAERAREEWETENFAEDEKEEIREIYEKKGFKGAELERAVEIITSDKKVWVDEMMIHELKMIEDEDSKPIKNAAAIFIAFVIAGAIPLVPYIFGLAGTEAFKWAMLSSALVLFVVGSLRTMVTGIRWWIAGVEMLLVGAGAAGVAYLVGALLGNIA